MESADDAVRLSTVARRRYLATAAAFAAAHLVLSFGSLFLGVRLGMERLGKGGDAGFLETAANGLAEVLFRPGTYLLSVGIPGTLEWAIFLGNSLLWGFVAASLIALIEERKSNGR